MAAPAARMRAAPCALGLTPSLSRGRLGVGNKSSVSALPPAADLAAAGDADDSALSGSICAASMPENSATRRVRVVNSIALRNAIRRL